MNRLKKIRNFNFLILGILAMLLFSFNSCCTKMYCSGAEDINGIVMVNFDSSEVDSVYIVFYTKNTNFKTVQDSLLLENINIEEDGSFKGFTSKRISIDYDYRLYFTMISKEYTVSSFQTSEVKCNSCFLAKDTYKKLDGYSVNENYRDGYEIKIDKLND